MYSTILNWQYDVGAMRELIEPISNFRTENPFHQSGDTGDYMAQHIFLLRDMPLALQIQIVEATPLPLNVEEHSVAIETVKADKKVDLHNDHLMGWKNPLTRKTNIMFNLEDEPLEIIHEDASHNKSLNPGELMILDVTKSHGANKHNLNRDFYLYTVNLRLSYKDTVEMLSTL